MKRVISRVGDILLYILFIPLTLLLVVGLLPVILWFAVSSAISKVFIKLRKDPKHIPPTRYEIYSHDYYPATEAELIKYFDKFISAIEKDCNVIASDMVKNEGLDKNSKATNYVDGNRYITLSTVIKTEKGKASIRMEAMGDYCDEGFFISMNDGDLPPYLEVVYSQHGKLRTVFWVSAASDMEFLVASLNNGQIVSRAGQVWAKLKDDLYMVNYSVKKSESSDRLGATYGYRRKLSDKKAREHYFDA